MRMQARKNSLMLKRSVLRLLCLLAGIGSVGCQNSLRVDVELIGGGDIHADVVGASPSVKVGPVGGTAQLDARGRLRFIRGLETTLAILNDVTDRIGTIHQALRELAYSEAELAGPQFRKYQNSKMQVADLKLEAEAMIPYMSPDHPLSSADVFSLKSLQGRMDVAIREGRSAIDRLEDRLVLRKGDEKSLEAYMSVHRALAEIGKSGAAAHHLASTGFGGFHTIGVCQINPADPAYRQILSKGNAQVVGTFSSVKADINGDSTIVFVQESPGQLRVFEIDSDPTQLMQNVAFIMDKALEAVVKYSDPQ